MSMSSSSACPSSKLSAYQRLQERKRLYEEFSETETDSCYESASDRDEEDHGEEGDHGCNGPSASADNSTHEVALILAGLEATTPAPLAHASASLAASIIMPVAKGRKRLCLVCSHGSSVGHCAKVILEEMEREFHPTGAEFVEMAATAMLNYHSRSIIPPTGSVASAMAFKMNQHRSDCSTVLARLVFSMLRSAVSDFKRNESIPLKTSGTRLNYVRNQLRLGEDVLPERYVDEHSARVKDMAAIFDAFALHQPQHLRIPPVFSSPKFCKSPK